MSRRSTEQLIKEALKAIADRENQEILNESEEELTVFSADFASRIDEAWLERRAKKRSVFLWPGKAAAVMILFFLFGSAVTAYGMYYFHFVIHEKADIEEVQIEFDPNVRERIEEIYELQNPPDGYSKIDQIKNEDLQVTTIYENGNKETLILHQYTNDLVLFQDDDTMVRERIFYEDQDAVYVYGKGYTSIIWQCEDYLFSIDFSVEMDLELIIGIIQLQKQEE